MTRHTFGNKAHIWSKRAHRRKTNAMMSEKRSTDSAPPTLMRNAIDVASRGAVTTSAAPAMPAAASCTDGSERSRSVQFGGRAWLLKGSPSGTMASSVVP